MDRVFCPRGFLMIVIVIVIFITIHLLSIPDVVAD